MAKKVMLGADNVVKKLEWLQKQSRRHNDVGVIVGYTAAYALHVHENVEMKWKGLPRDPRKWSFHPTTGRQIKHQKNPRKRQVSPKGKYWDPQATGSAKFLEAPFRVMKDQLYDTIFKTTKALGIAKGNGLDIGLMKAGLLLQRTSQLLVPVDLGNLKASAFTRLVHRNRGKG